MIRYSNYLITGDPVCYVLLNWAVEVSGSGGGGGTWMQAPAFSLHRQQIRAHLLLGMWDTLVMGSIFSGFPMLTCTAGRTRHAPAGKHTMTGGRG